MEVRIGVQRETWEAIYACIGNIVKSHKGKNKSELIDIFKAMHLLSTNKTGCSAIKLTIKDTYQPTE